MKLTKEHLYDAVGQLKRFIDESGDTSTSIMINEVHNYSTEEHIVGTWIDNKPLYEKTILINDLSESTITSQPGGGYVYTKVISQLVPDIHKFISLEAFNETHGQYYPYIFQDESNKNYSIAVIVDLSLGGFYISFSKSINISAYYGSNIYITIKYTKTTDSPITPQTSLENAINNTTFSNLTTESKNLVGAINEINGNTLNQDGVVLKKVGNIIFVYLTSVISLNGDGKTITTITNSDFIPKDQPISTLTYCYNGEYIPCRILFDKDGNITVTDFYNRVISNLQVGFLQTKSFLFIQ